MKPNVIECKEQDLIERCNQRNVNIKSAMQSVVHKDGDKWFVDVNHPAYPKPNGLGDRVEKVLRTVGITPERVSKLTGKPCNCGKRKKALNQFGERLGIK